MHKSNIEILQILNKNECTSELKSFSIFKILQSTRYKYSKVHNDLNALISAEYVNKGLKSERADTFYITKKGIDMLKEMSKQ